MDIRYYIPVIGDFCEGFEYEVYIGERTCYSLETFHFNDSHMNLVRQKIASNEIRAKYLDKQDIESLGFQVKITDCGEDTEDYEDIYQDGAIIGSFFPKDEMNIKLFENYFRVKNKSQFKRLLEQLDLK
jgi:hypothetical protein